MIIGFFEFVLDVFSGIMYVLDYTDFGAFTLEDILVALLVVSIVARTLIVRFGE